MLSRWTAKVAKYEQMFLAAEDYNEMNVQNKAISMWDFWKTQTHYRGIEKLVRDRVDARVQATAVERWRNKL